MGALGALVAFVSSLVAALVVLYGNHRQQRRLIQRLREADDLKQSLYNLVELASGYWTLEDGDSSRAAFEGRIVAAQLVVLSKCREMRRHSRRLCAWYVSTDECRLDLIDALSGGCFQAEPWEREPGRVARVGRVVSELVRSLNRAC